MPFEVVGGVFMAKKSMIVKQSRKQKVFYKRRYTRLGGCGRPHAYRKYGICEICFP